MDRTGENSRPNGGISARNFEGLVPRGRSDRTAPVTVIDRLGGPAEPPVANFTLRSIHSDMRIFDEI